MDVKEFWTKVKNALKAGMHKFSIWFNASAKPELLEFLDDNKELALKLVTEAAQYYAGKPSHLKFESVYNHLTEEFKDNAGNLTIDNQWIRLLIELAVAVAKASGKI